VGEEKGKSMLQPTDKLNVTFDAQAWNVIMQIIAEAPFKIAQPLIQEIQRQCASQDTGPDYPSAGRHVRPNGAAGHDTTTAE
jgi:hypothetical protein